MSSTYSLVFASSISKKVKVDIWQQQLPTAHDDQRVRLL